MTAVVVLLITHNAISAARVHFPSTRKLFGREAVVLVVGGHIRRRALDRAHMTVDDLHTALRERGVTSVAEVRLAVLESRGAFSVLRAETQDDRLWPERPEAPGTGG